MNDRIHTGIYKHFLHSEPDKQRDLADQYVVAVDLIRADTESTPDEIQRTQLDYLFWRSLAAPKTWDKLIQPTLPWRATTKHAMTLLSRMVIQTPRIPSSKM